jgi:hypothetical protein
MDDIQVLWCQLRMNTEPENSPSGRLVGDMCDLCLLLYEGRGLANVSDKIDPIVFGSGSLTKRKAV